MSSFLHLKLMLALQALLCQGDIPPLFLKLLLYTEFLYALHSRDTSVYVYMLIACYDFL
jgi:hypothetical protein